MPSSLIRHRYGLVLAFVSALFLIVLYQLLQLGVFHRSALENFAHKQHRLDIEIPPFRGQIFDRDGKELVTNLKVPSVYAIPRVVASRQREALVRSASQILSMPSSIVSDRLLRDKSFVWLKRRVGPQEAQKIQALKNHALGIVQEYKRFYAQGDLLAHVLGLCNVDGQGLEGLEFYYNSELQGRAGRRLTKRDALGREIRAQEIKTIPAVDGNRLWLTIDPQIQYLTERALDRAFRQWKAKGASAIVMEAKTGRVLAMANRPTFDPNHPESSTAPGRRNRAITDMYEPGSVFKIVTASALLNENKVTPQTEFQCENGKFRYGSKVLHDVHPYGTLTFEQVIVKSSNIGTVKAASRLAPRTLEAYIDAFGFGKPTGIDLPGEAPGFRRPASEWSKTSPYNIPIGQEILVTALQMTAAMGVIANGGYLVQPYAIERIEDPAGVALKKKRPTVKGQVLRPEVAETMRKILVKAVQEGTGTRAKIEGIPVGGKTGTAQKILARGRGYSHHNFTASFVGFAPAEDPSFVMAVVLDDPKPSYYGGTVSAPVFKEVMENALLSRGYIPQNAKSLTPEDGGPPSSPKSPPPVPRTEGLGSKSQPLGFQPER